jgi:L-malate glycosyltransferase
MNCMPEKRKQNDVRLKVFYFIDSLNLGGSENQLVQTALRLDRDKYSLTVGCLRAEGPFLDTLQTAGIRIVEFDPQGSIWKPRGLWEIARVAVFLRRERFDVIHTYDLYSNLMGVPAAWLARTPMRISSRRDLGGWHWYTPRRRRILRRILALSHLILANSEAVQRCIVEEERYPSEKTCVVRNGIDIQRFTAVCAERSQVLPTLTNADKVVTMIANMHSERKGHMEFIRAARVVCTRLTRAKFVLVGDGVERQSLEQLTRELGLAAKILFLGRRTDVAEILKCSDLSVLPSWAEGLPNVVMESVAVGTPVVATRVGGIPEIIEDGVSGLLVPPRDPAALAAAIIRMLVEPKLGASMAAAALERLRARFSFSNVIETLEEIYSQAREDDSQ